MEFREWTVAEREKLSRERSKRIIRYVEAGKIVELGCGSGATLSILAEHFPNSIIIGVDNSEKKLCEVNAKNLKNVIPVKADITSKIFPGCTFNTAILKFSLHEVGSVYGEDGVIRTLTNSYNILKPGGKLILYEHLRLDPEKVRMRIKHDYIKRRFMKFAEEFKPRNVQYEIKKDWVVLDKADCLEFLTKYASKDWEEEMKEAHYFYTLDDFRQRLLKTGFSIKTERKYKFEKRIWKEKLEIVDVNFENPESYILMVAERPR